jgi:hypothetical protein
MRPATLRRLLVFGVCLVGVGCLYLVPSMAGSSSRLDGRQAVPTAPADSTTLGPAVTPLASPAPATPAQTPTNDPHRLAMQPRTGATAVEPGRDDRPPDAVGRLRLVSADPDRLTISWSAPDDRDVVGYRVWLNGFLVLSTQQTRATLSWFNDSDTHVIQVRAVDAAGTEGASSTTLLVRRPVPTTQPAAPIPSPSSRTISTNPTTSESPRPVENPGTTATSDTERAASASERAEKEGGNEEDGS